MSGDPLFQAVLVSVGGSSDPIVHVLRQHTPEHVWFFCSPDSRRVAEEMVRQLDWHPNRDFIEVEKFEDLGSCYRVLRREIPVLLRKWRVTPDRTLVDYTGGTKTMSAALVLAAVEVFQHLGYVQSRKRDKDGLGVGVSGYEHSTVKMNPWSEMAVREVERAADLWNGFQFEAAADVLRVVALKVEKRIRFESIAELADAMAARHRLDFHGALRRLGTICRNLPALYDGQDDKGLISFCNESLKICSACSESRDSTMQLLRELLDNALRTASQGRYEDAAARLYRAMEMQGQIWLRIKTNGLFVNGKCSGSRIKEIPESIASLDFFKVNDRREVKFSMEQVFKCLASLGDPSAIRIVQDIDQVDGNGKPASQWRNATQKRNASILAHGVEAVSANGFDELKRIAQDFLGFELDAESHPIPHLNHGWFSFD